MGFFEAAGKIGKAMAEKGAEMKLMKDEMESKGDSELISILTDKGFILGGYDHSNQKRLMARSLLHKRGYSPQEINEFK
jgi:hypothetical protein